MVKNAIKNATPEDLKAFLDWLDPDADAAEERYFDIRRRLITLIFRNAADAEELADETLARAIENASKRERNPETVENFIFKIARFVKYEQHRKTPLDELPPDLPAVQTNQEKQDLERRYEIMEKCIGKLSPADRDLFLKYTYPPENEDEYLFRKQLAQQENVSLNHLRVRMVRIRAKIRVCAEAEIE